MGIENLSHITKLLILFIFTWNNVFSQVNIISNPGFEFVQNCGNISGSFILEALPWDTLKSGGGGGYPLHSCFPLSSNCSTPSNLSGGGFQYPRTGDGYCYIVYLKLTPDPSVNWRWYIQQRMKQRLIAGKSYCVTYWASLINYVNYAVDELGAYFDDGNIQSIGFAKEAIANPQVKSPSGLFYKDTLNWMKVQGSFVANGTEEYITIGNFRLTSATTYTSLDGNTAGIASYFIDDVSVIESDLPAYAGNDVWALPGNTVYIGRTREIGLDDACTWYKLPNTTSAIDTAAGITVFVGATTNTYMVKQDLCGNIKYDTVIVYSSDVGLKEINNENNNIILSPNPSDEVLKLEFVKGNRNKFNEYVIYNELGNVVKQNELEIDKNKAVIHIENIPNGTYILELKNGKQIARKRFVILRG